MQRIKRTRITNRTRHQRCLDHHLGLCTRRTTCSFRVRVGIELDFLSFRKFEDFLETFPTPSTTMIEERERGKGWKGGYPMAFKTSWLVQDFVHKPIL